MDIFKSLLDHFQDIANAFHDEKLATTLFPHVAEKTLTREDLLRTFLIDRLPTRCQVVKNCLAFDSSGNVSKQIDLMVTSDLAIHFKHSDRSFYCLEGCHCAMLVRDRLDKSSLFDSLESLASVPVTPEVPAGLDFLLGTKNQGMLLKVVFAFEGTSPEDTLDYVEEFYAANPIPDKGKPNVIIVNNGYGVVRTGEQGAITTSGLEIPAHTFHTFGCSTDEPCIGGYSLMYLLTEIQRVVASAPQATIDYGDYLDQLPL